MSKDLVKLGGEFIKEWSPNRAYKEHHDYKLKDKSLNVVAGLAVLGMGLLYKLADKIADKDKAEIEMKYKNSHIKVKGENYKR